MVTEIKTANEFEEATKQGVVLVDFWATWCGPCKMLAPVIEQLSAEFVGQLNFYKFDVDGDREIPEKFEIMSVPTLMLFKDGQLLSKKIGLASKNILKDWIENTIK